MLAVSTEPKAGSHCVPSLLWPATTLYLITSMRALSAHMNSSSRLAQLRAEWAPVPRELLAGAVATFALIPEVIAFFNAGAGPQSALCIVHHQHRDCGVWCARPAMVPAAAGSVALVAAPLVRITWSAISAGGAGFGMAGAVQIVFGLLKMGSLGALCFPGPCAPAL